MTFHEYGPIGLLLVILALVAIAIWRGGGGRVPVTPMGEIPSGRRARYSGPLGIEFIGPEGTGYSNITRSFRDEWIGLIEEARAVGVEVVHADDCARGRGRAP